MTLLYDIIKTLISLMAPNFWPAIHLPKVSRALKLKIKISIVQDMRSPSFLIPDKNSNFVSVIKAGKITNVMKNTKARLVKNSFASKKLFFIIIKKITI